MLVVNGNFELRGLITVKDILKSSEHPNACKDDLGKLRVGAAVGVVVAGALMRDAVTSARGRRDEIGDSLQHALLLGVAAVTRLDVDVRPLRVLEPDRK